MILLCLHANKQASQLVVDLLLVRLWLIDLQDVRSASNEVNECDDLFPCRIRTRN